MGTWLMVTVAPHVQSMMRLRVSVQTILLVVQTHVHTDAAMELWIQLVLTQNSVTMRILPRETVAVAHAQLRLRSHAQG